MIYKQYENENEFFFPMHDSISLYFCICYLLYVVKELKREECINKDLWSQALSVFKEHFLRLRSGIGDPRSAVNMLGQADRGFDEKTDRQADRQTDRQTDRKDEWMNE